MSGQQSDYLLPGWSRTTLSEIAQPTRPRCAPADFPDLPFIGMEHVEAHSMRLLGTVPAGEMKSSAVHFQPGDALYGRLRPYLNKVHVAKCEGMCSAEFIVFPGDTPINSTWLGYLLNSSDFMFFASHLPTGDRPRVDFDQIGGYEVRLPPRPEQDRIVAEIEKQFTLLDAGVAALKRVQSNLKRYRAAVLRAACEGRLVPTEAELARRERRSYETGEQLLARILQERRAKWEANQLAKMVAAGKPPKDDSWKKKYKEPVPPDISDLPPLPEGWVWTNLDQLKLFSIYGPRFSSNDYVNEGTVVLRTTDISEGGKVDLSSAPKLRLSAAEVEKYKLISGDLVFTRTGATIGKTAIFNDEVEAIPGAYLIHFRLVIPAATAWYVYRFFQSVPGQERLLAGRLGIGQPNLNAPSIEAIPIPLPPVTEQQRILAAVDVHLPIVEQNAIQIFESCRRADRLRQAILKRAFEGKLVPQDPNDEPASMLLERIYAERSTQASAKSGLDRTRKSRRFAGATVVR